MADELTIAGGLTLNNKGKKAGLSGSEKKDQAGDHYIQRVDNIGTVEETISKGDIGTLGYCAFKNVGDSGTIKIGGTTGVYMMELAPGEFVGPIKWTTSNVYAIADTPAKLELLLCEL